MMLRDREIPTQKAAEEAIQDSGFRHSTFDFQLLSWFDLNKRDLPWRRTQDPYAVWVSEVMLQQTQVATVIPYYNRWMTRFPTVESLAAADEQEVLSLWQGLGYYRRCRMLLEGAKQVFTHGLPTDANGWQKIKGVGRYTAGAIASIALNEPVPVVDGNVERVFARLTACDSGRPELTNKAWGWAQKVLSHERSGDWNQALMELGATVCTASNPSCEKCPIRSNCLAYKRGLVDELPRAKPKAATVKLQHAVWIPMHGSKIGVRQIPQGEWWEGMWEFPRVDKCKSAELAAITGLGNIAALRTIRHSVTHHRIEVEVFTIECQTMSANLKWVTVEELQRLPMPAPQRKAFGLLSRLET
ncbi:MAG TPA: A/G-specific adenine glycosylase [Fimbriimonadaceae bacterium]|jgi:A/G-specific adenine glycosylase